MRELGDDTKWCDRHTDRRTQPFIVKDGNEGDDVTDGQTHPYIVKDDSICYYYGGTTI